MLKKRDKIIVRVRKEQTRYLKKSNKFGIELPQTVEQVVNMDTKIDSIFWADAISKELENIKETLRLYQIRIRCPQATSLCDAVWYLISKWKISNVTVDLWQEEHDQSTS